MRGEDKKSVVPAITGEVVPRVVVHLACAAAKEGLAVGLLFVEDGLNTWIGHNSGLQEHQSI